MEHSNKAESRYLRLPPDCCFMMQQWLYRRTSHTRRYKRSYVVLHKDRIYSLRKPPTSQGAKPESLAESLRYNCWIIAGAEIKAEPHELGGLYKWKLLLKNPKRQATQTNEVFNEVFSKVHVANSLYSDNHRVEEIFQELNDGNCVSVSTPGQYAEDHTIWFATSNHKVACDWLMAMLYATRYGSLQNFVYQNPMRSKRLAFSLPFYLLPFDFIPPSVNKELSRGWKAAFTYMRLNIIQLLNIPMFPTDTLCCLVEYNSSFYVISLPHVKEDGKVEVKSTFSSLSDIEEEPRDLHWDDEMVLPLREKNMWKVSDVSQVQITPRDGSQGKHIATRLSGLLGRNDHLSNIDITDDDRGKAKVGTAALIGNQTQSGTMLSKFWNLNKGSEKKKAVILKRTMDFGEDAYIHIPLYKNTSQDMIWLHFVTTSDIYIGSASIDYTDCTIKKPCRPKTCVIKHIEEINPLSHKRVDISDYAVQTSALKNSTVNDPVPEAGLVVLSIISVNNYGNFMDPVTPAFNSPKEYLNKATNASTAGSLNMLTSNLKRGINAYRTTYSLRRYVRRVLQFKNPWLSNFWIFYLILGLGLFPDKLLFFAILGLIFYIIRSHPKVNESIILFLLRYPIVMSLLPRWLVRKVMLLPKAACMICAKRKSFLLKNSYETDEKVHREIVALKRLVVPDHMKGRLSIRKMDAVTPMEQLVYIEKSYPPMLTSTHAMKGYVSFTAYPGTGVERCKHRGVLQSYLSSLFLNHFAGTSAFNSFKKTDSRKVIQAFHSVMYEPPPYPWAVVPLYHNVILTVKYYFMIFLLTFMGGIEHVQILHLLHRNRVGKKLFMESVYAESEHKERERLYAPSGGKKVKNESSVHEWYENERKTLWAPFSGENLRYNDRPRISTEDGKPIRIPEIFTYNARILVTTKTDQSGWEYAKSWNSVWSKAPNVFTLVRRRRWVVGYKDDQLPKDMIARKTVKQKKPESYMSSQFDSIKDIKEEETERYVSNSYSFTPRSVEAGKRINPLRIDEDSSQRCMESARSNGTTAGGSTTGFVAATGEVGQKVAFPRRRIFQRIIHFKAEDDNQHSSTTMLGRIKKGLSALKKEAPTPLEMAAADMDSTGTEPATGFSLRRWKKNWYNIRREEEQKEEPEPVVPIIVKPALVAAIPKETQEYNMASDPKENILEGENNKYEDWSTDSEVEEKKETSEKRNLLNNAVAFVLIMPLCLLLDLFKVVVKILVTIINVLFWFLGISAEEDVYSIIPEEVPIRHEMEWKRPRARCSLISQGGKYYFEIPKLRKRCFMGKRKLMIYNAAQGRKARLRAFTQKRAYRNLKIMFLHTRTKPMGNVEHDPEEEDYETLFFGSEFEEHRREDNEITKVPDEIAPEFEEPGSESSSDDSMASDDVKLLVSMNNDSMEVDMNNFVLDGQNDSEQEGIRDELLTTSENETQHKRVKFYSYIKKIYDKKIRKSQVEGGDDNEAGEEAKPSSDYEGVETHNNMKTEQKLSVLGMLRKAKDRIVVGNYYINLFTMRYEKFINMFHWGNETVTKVVIIILAAVAIGNFLVSTNLLLLVYLLLFFKSGYAAGLWERNLLHTVRRHLNSALAELEIYHPFWDLSNKQIITLTKAIKDFCQVEVTSTTIREAENRWDLAQAITTQIIEQKMCKGWSRTNWFINLFRQSPDLKEA